MHSEKVNLSHRALLTEKFQKLGTPISEYNFANIYLFRQIHHYEIIFAHDVFIKGLTRDGCSFLMPTTSFAHIDFGAIKSLLSQVDFLFPISETWLEGLRPQPFTFSFLDDDSDYLFTRDKMSSYPGRDLASRRNLVKQFLATYRVQAYPLTTDRVEDALQILDKWQSGQEQDSRYNDYFSCREALEQLDNLGLKGYIFYINETQPAAFILGQNITLDTYALLFVKADKLLKGIYQYIYQALAQSLDESIQFLNLGQDLGSPALRQAKRSYLPDRMLHKLRVKIPWT